MCSLALAMRYPEHREGALLLPTALPVVPRDVARELLILLQSSSASLLKFFLKKEGRTKGSIFPRCSITTSHRDHLVADDC